MKKKRWAIRGRDMLDGKIVYWKNDQGWCRNEYTIFTDKERNTFNLPMGMMVEWVKLKEIDR